MRLINQVLHHSRVVLLLSCVFVPLSVCADAADINGDEPVVVSQALLNINAASAEDIAAHLRGIGLKKAQAIVAWRELQGQFTRKDQLLDVKGIGESTLAKNSDRISLE